MKRIDVRIGAVIFIVLILLFIGLPILNGDASLPTDLSPDHIGNFFGGILNYWRAVADAVSQQFGPSEEEAVPTDQEPSPGGSV